MLITVAVATYNSAAFVIETLDSIAFQTYTDLELIISDDCSTDGTVALVKEWINKISKTKRFSRIELLLVDKNTGVSANCNRILKATKGEYIKFIAGDDILFPNCIDENVSYVKKNAQAEIVFSQIALYKDTFNPNNFIKYSPSEYPINIMNEKFSANDQFNLLLESDRINYTPSGFFKMEVFRRIGGYDESFKLVEDYPMWLKLTSNGVRLWYFHVLTVGYRIHEKATNNVGGNSIFPPSLINNYLVRKKYAFPYLGNLKKANETLIYFVSSLFIKLSINKKIGLYPLIYRLLIVYLNPFFILSRLKERWELIINGKF